MNIKPWHCAKCRILLGHINGNILYLDEGGGRVKVEIELAEGTVKRWCSRCEKINILRPVKNVSLLEFE